MTVTETKYGDRWDLLAYDLYGDASMTAQLMEANPSLLSESESHLPEGAEVIVPQIEATQRITHIKAPWKD